MKRWKLWVALILVFASGFIFGGVGSLMWVRHRIAHAAENDGRGIRWVVVHKLAHDLDLTSDQKAVAETAVMHAQENFRALRQEIRPQIRQIVEETKLEIKPCLTPEQQKKLDELHARMEKRWSGTAR